MSYTKSPKTIWRVHDMLECLVNSNRTLRIICGDATLLAHQMREAFFNVPLFENGEPFKEVVRHYVISAVDDKQLDFIWSDEEIETEEEKKLAAILGDEQINVSPLYFNTDEPQEDKGHTRGFPEPREEGPQLPPDELAREMRDLLRMARLPGISTLAGIMETFPKYAAKNSEVFFEELMLETDDLTRLRRFLNGDYADWLIVPSDGGIVLTTRKDLPEGVAWTPEEAQNE